MNSKMTKCKACGADIAKSAKVCPACGEKHRVTHPVIGIIILAFGLILIAGALFGSNSEPKKIGQQPDASTSSANVQEETTFGVGDKVELHDIVATLTDVSENNGSQFNRPESGNSFVLCQFEIENNSSKDIAVSSIMSFEAYVDGYSTNMSLSAMIGSDKTQLDGKVAAGKKMSGVIGYEVPSDWSELEVKFTPDFWGGQDITFIASK